MNQLSNTILNAVLNTGWQAVAITLTVWALLRVTRVSAATRHIIWWAVLAMLVALPFAPSLLSRRSAAILPAESRFTPPEAPVAIERYAAPAEGPVPVRERGPVNWRPGNLPMLLLVLAAAGFL